MLKKDIEQFKLGLEGILKLLFVYNEFETYDIDIESSKNKVSVSVQTIGKTILFIEKDKDIYDYFKELKKVNGAFKDFEHVTYHIDSSNRVLNLTFFNSSLKNFKDSFIENGLVNNNIVIDSNIEGSFKNELITSSFLDFSDKSLVCVEVSSEYSQLEDTENYKRIQLHDYLRHDIFMENVNKLFEIINGYHNSVVFFKDVSYSFLYKIKAIYNQGVKDRQNLFFDRTPIFMVTIDTKESDDLSSNTLSYFSDFKFITERTHGKFDVINRGRLLTDCFIKGNTEDNEEFSFNYITFFQEPTIKKIKNTLSKEDILEKMEIVEKNFLSEMNDLKNMLQKL